MSETSVDAMHPPSPPARIRSRRFWQRAPEPPKSREQIAYEEAKRAADRRVGFFSHATVFAMVILLLMVTAGFYPAMVVALAWGIGLASHGYSAVIAPGLHKRWLEEEYRLRLGPEGQQARRVEQGRHAKNLEALSASIAHEIRNPITAAKSLVQQMGEDPAAEDNVEYAKVALEELDRVERSISHLLRYAREEAVTFSAMDLHDVVASALETFEERITRAGVEVESAVDPGTTLQGDAEKLRRVVINLVGNALDELEASPPASPRITITGGGNLAGTEAWLKVKDNGPGIPQEHLPKIFSPFQTSKEGGTGLGLAITKKVVEAHHGTIEARSVEGEGTEMEVVLPRAPEASA